MNNLILIGIAVVIILYLLLKWGHLKTRISFFLVLFGTILVVFFIFLLVSGSQFNFSSIGDAVSSVRVSLLWLKSAATDAFEFTGKAIGMIKNNSTG